MAFRRRHGRRRGPIRRRIFRRRRMHKRRTVPKITKKIIRKTVRRGKHLPIGQVSRPFGRPIHCLKTFSNTVQIVIPQTQANGLSQAMFSLENFILATELSELIANHLQWQLYGASMTIKVTDTSQLAQYVNLGVATGNALINVDTCSTNQVDLWLMVHHSMASYNEYSVVSNLTTSARNGIINSNMAKKLLVKGKPLTYQWHLPQGTRGSYQPLHASSFTTSTPINGASGAFSGSTNINNCPTGFQLNWFDIANYTATGVTATGSITVEFIGTMVVDLVGRPFQIV